MTCTAQALRDSFSLLDVRALMLEQGGAGGSRLPISAPREQGAALSVRGSSQVLSPMPVASWRQGLTAQSSADPAAAPPSPPPSAQGLRRPAPPRLSGTRGPRGCMWPRQEAAASAGPLDKGSRRELQPEAEPKTRLAGARPVL